MSARKVDSIPEEEKEIFRNFYKNEWEQEKPLIVVLENIV